MQMGSSVMNICIIVGAVIVVTFQSSSPISQEVEHLIREYRWNQALMQNVVDDYEIVYPFQVRDRNRVAIDTRNYYFTNATIHFDRCTFVIKSSYNRFKLHLAQNRLLIPPGARYKQIFNDSFRLEVRGDTVEHCFYQGEVHNEETSKVALSTCNGLRGVIIIGNQTYFILPLQGGDLGRRHPHLLIRAKMHQKLNCPVHGKTEWSSVSNRKETSRRNRRDGNKETKYIELALIADQSSFVEFEASFAALTRFILEAVNGLDLILSELNTRVTLVHFETWSSKNLIQLNDDVTQTMLNFLQFASTVTYSERTDIMLLMTSSRFSRQESALAVSNSVCTARAAGVFSNPSRFEEHQLSVVMAHTVAHILGMKHDDESCDCPDRYGCLMSTSMSGKRMRYVHGFSSCNHADYLSMLSTQQARCLFNKPLEDNVLIKCGNRIVDDGEQCDCGSVEECDLIDSCCDPVTCTLREGAECGAGPCCRDCKLLSRTHVCRPADDECDVPEFCTTKSGQCPPDARMLNGETCDDGNGYCYKGKCSSARRQCVELWGSDADKAESECFERFNVLGQELGHCGYDDRNRPKPCLPKNALCGLLHCKGGVEAPSAPSYLKTYGALKGKPLECKTVGSGTNLTYMPGMVKSGVGCGSQKICIDQSCVDLSTVAVEPDCPTNNVALPCSGHGVCTTENTCFCNNNWASEDCGTKLNVSSPALFSAAVTSPTTSSTWVSKRANGNSTGISYFSNDHQGQRLGSTNVEIYTMFIILGAVATVVLVILMFLVLCYRRRTTTNLQKKLNSKTRNNDRESDSSIDTAHRSIRFGSLPSYRDEKMQLKNNKKRALHKINEADEKDSISTNKSRESNHSANGSMHIVDDHASKPPDRGILKNGPIFGNGMMVPHSLSDVDEPQCTSPLLGPRDGYESEPPPYASMAACRVFQNSLRRLNECDIYRHRLSPEACDMESEPFPDMESMANTHALSLKVRSHTPSNLSYRPPASMDQNYRRSHSTSPNDYSSDNLSSRCLPLQNQDSKDDTVRQGMSNERPSPVESVQSNKLGNGNLLTKPQPLQLKNIEFLLRQLDCQQQQMCRSLIVSPSSSTTEMSSAEADKLMVKENNDDQKEEVGSNTESNRDEASSSRYQSINNGLSGIDEIGSFMNGHSSRSSPAKTPVENESGVNLPMRNFQQKGTYKENNHQSDLSPKFGNGIRRS